MSDFQIANYFKGVDGFAGVFSNNEFPKNPDPKKVYILNLEDSHEDGSHWTLYHNNSYFDSYGCVPTKRIAPHVKSHNTVNYQGLNKSSCGYFTMYVADHILTGHNPLGRLQPDRQQHNENILESYFFGA